MKFLIKKIITIALSTLVAIPLLALADDASRDKEIAERFAKCDLNHDGKLTLEEPKDACLVSITTLAILTLLTRAMSLWLKFRLWLIGNIEII